MDVDEKTKKTCQNLRLILKAFENKIPVELEGHTYIMEDGALFIKSESYTVGNEEEKREVLLNCLFDANSFLEMAHKLLESTRLSLQFNLIRRSKVKKRRSNGVFPGIN